MAAFALLPSEILAHILNLSNEGESAQERQRSRFSFGLIARASFLATADATDFYVAGEKQAKALAAKLEREKKWVVQEERKARSGRTTRATTLSLTRLSNVRRLSLTLDWEPKKSACIDLLQAMPHLLALELDLNRVADPREAAAVGWAAALEVALGGLASLRTLRYNTRYLYGAHFSRILLPLKQLRILDLEMKAYGLDVRDVQLDQLALSHFHTLRIRLHSPRTGFPVPFNNTLLRALATGSTSGIHVLDLTYTTSTWLTSDMVDSAVNHIASVVHFIWTPELVVMGRGPRKALTRLLRGMVNLQSITIATWLRADSTDSEDEDEAEEYLAGQQNFIDPKLLDVLANVPSLHTVNLVDSFGMVEEHALISFIEKRPTLRFLTVKVDRDGWTQEHKDRVERASEGAGVVFLYHGNNV